MDRAYLALPSAPGTLAPVLAALHALPFDGFNVTTPHKEEAAAACTSLDPLARRLGAANTLVRTPKGWKGYSTDGDGFLLWLRECRNRDPAGRTCLVLGTGGASRSVLQALGRARPARLTLLTRDPAACRTPFYRGREVLGYADPAAARALAEAELVVHGTPWGTARASGAFPLDLGRIGKGALAVDMNYDLGKPTGFLAALPAGVRGFDGRGMLAGQAALAFELWTGERPALAEIYRVGGLGKPGRA